jgi:flagellar biosynthesis protein FlhG
MLRTSDQADGLRVARDSRAPQLRPLRSTIDTARSIAVTSGKGGVGKTQLSANLALALGKRGQKVLLLDADLGLASLDLALGIHPHADLLSVVRGERNIDDILVEAAHGVQLVPACPGRYEMANLGTAEREKLRAVIEDLARRFDVLVIDTGAGIGANSVGFASLASEVLLVTTPDPTSLRDAYAMAKVLNKRAGVDSIALVANQVPSEAGGLEVYERLLGIAQRFLSLELRYLGCIPKDETVARAVASGHPYVIGAPHSKAARALESLVERLMQRSTTPDLMC